MTLIAVILQQFVLVTLDINSLCGHFNENAFNMYLYSCNFLLERRRSMDSVISPALQEIINSHSQQKALRTSRGGIRKHRKIPVLLSLHGLANPAKANKPTGVNFSNLVFLTDTKKIWRKEGSHQLVWWLIISKPDC